MHRDGGVTVAVSTGGRSPALASWLRSRPGLGTLAELLGEARDRLRETGVRTDSVNWAELLDGSLPGLVQAGEIDQAREVIASATGRR